MTLKAEILPILFWRCPVCRANANLILDKHIFKRSTLSCKSCQTVWELRHDAMSLRGEQSLSLENIPNTIDDWYQVHEQIPIDLHPISATTAILKRGESPLLEQRATLYKEKTINQRVGGSRGMSVRVARGVYAKVGAYSGRTISHREIQPLQTGIMTLTNKRILFSGGSHATIIQLGNVTHLEASGGIIHTHGQKVALLGGIGNSVLKWERYILAVLQSIQ